MPILVRTDSADFAALLEDRYGSFIKPLAPSPQPLAPAREACLAPAREACLAPAREACLDIDLISPRTIEEDEDVSVRLESGRWIIARGDFRAEFDPRTGHGWIRQSPNPYSIDGVLRILHSLFLAREGGFLVHAASAVRNGRAFLFAGVSGAGKTTLSRLAPPDAEVLTDEISYVRPESGADAEGGADAESGADAPVRERPPGRSLGYVAFGTPFAGELARIGANLRAPLAALYLLVQGPENRIEPVDPAEAARAVLRNILFFAHDEELVGLVFKSVFDFVARVPVHRLIFTPDARAWELIR
jgi:hypothetical protein